MDRKHCQSKYYKLQQRTPSETELASRLHIASDHALESGESKNIHLNIVKLTQTEKVIQTLKSV